MRIAIDTLGGDHGRSGFGSYILYFISNLPKNPDIQIELFGTEEDRYTYTSGTDIPYSAIKLLDTPRALRRWYKYHANRFIKKQGYDAVIYPTACRMVPPKYKNHIGVAVINSIMSSEIADKSGKEKHQLKKGILKAQKIIANPEFIDSYNTMLRIFNDMQKSSGLLEMVARTNIRNKRTFSDKINALERYLDAFEEVLRQVVEYKSGLNTNVDDIIKIANKYFSEPYIYTVVVEN